jgi:sortase A
MAGASGRTLAFGPGHMDGTPPPGAPGISVVSAHRDTHFHFLKALKVGDALQVTTPDRATLAYRVTDIRIVNAETARIETDGDTPRLALVTCYPFDAIETGGPLRYVVMAEAAPMATAEHAANR